MGISASVARKFFIEIPTVGKSGEFDLKYPNCNSVTIGERNQNSNGGPNRETSLYCSVLPDADIKIDPIQLQKTPLQPPPNK